MMLKVTGKDHEERAWEHTEVTAEISLNAELNDVINS